MNFSYIWFALLIFLFAVGDGPVLLPQPGLGHEQPAARPAGRRSRDAQYLQNSAQVLSMGLFFTIVTLGLAADLPAHLFQGLTSCRRKPPGRRAGWPTNRRSEACSRPSWATTPCRSSRARPVPCSSSAPPGRLRHGAFVLPQAHRGAVLAGPAPAFDFAAGATLIAVVASALRGGRYVHKAQPVAEELAEGAAESAAVDRVARGPRGPRRGDGATATDAPGQASLPAVTR